MNVSTVSSVSLHQDSFLLSQAESQASQADSPGFHSRHLNDFTTERILKERTEYEESDLLGLVSLCPSRHGGLLDYPKLVTGSAGWVTEKWEVCLRLVRPGYYLCSSSSDLIGAEQPQEEPDDFFSSVMESATKLISHHAWLTEVLVKAGDFEKVAGVAGGLALVRNKLWQLSGETGELAGLYRETCDLVESLCEQMTLYYSNSLTAALLDSDSQDWEDPRAFHEGERVSYCVQMWWFTMETTRQYLWASLPPNMSQNIFLPVLSQSLSTLVSRYSTISPSSARLPQYRADLLALLLAVSELLPCVTEELGDLETCRPESVEMRSVHTKCDLLLSLLVTVTAPAASLLSSLQTSTTTSPGVPRSDWRRLVCPLYRQTSPPGRVYLLARLVSDLPQPAWPLLAQLCLTSGLELPRLLASQMGAFVPSPGCGEAGPGRCGSEAQCTSGVSVCLGPADSNWPVLVVLGSLLPLLTDLSSSSSSLTQVQSPPLPSH